MATIIKVWLVKFSSRPRKASCFVKMDIPAFNDIFEQIKINFWLIGIPLGNSKMTIRYFVFLFCLSLMVSEEIAFFLSRFSVENFLELTQLAPCTFIGLLSILKIIFITIQRQKIYDLSQSLKHLYEDFLGDPIKRNFVSKDFLFLKYLVKCFFILNAILISVYNFSTLIFLAYHYYTKNEILFTLPYAVLLPFSTISWSTWSIVYLHSIISGKLVF